jgi:DNA-binding transcriptional regulator YdaS (Cro superfamily)
MDAIERAAQILGSQSALADLCGVSKGAVSQWKEVGRRVPAEYCPLIEGATGGEVRCEDLRPDMNWFVLRSKQATRKVGSQQQQQPQRPINDVDTDLHSSIDNSSKG